MKIKCNVALIMTTLIALLFSQTGSAALMKYTYQSPVMSFAREQSRQVDGPGGGYEFFFWGYEEQVTVEFVIPELEYELDEFDEHFFASFSNPVISVKAPGFFDSITINSSSFDFVAREYHGDVLQGWTLYLDITENNSQKHGDRRATFILDGYLDVMKLYQKNMYYKRCDGNYPPEWNMGCFAGVYDITAEFEGQHSGDYLDEYPGGINGMFGQPVRVPEPMSAVLLLIGMAGIFCLRTRKFKPD